jgi:hypothetical protein
MLLVGLWATPLVTTTWGGLLPKPLFPPAYHAALSVVPILLTANLLMGSLVQASVWYKLSHTPLLGIGITAIGSLITWIGNLYGIPRYGYPACAWTTLAAYVGMVGVSVGIGRHRLPGAFPMRPLLVPVITAGGLLGWATSATELSFFPRILLSMAGTSVIGTWLFLQLRREATTT